MATRYQLYKDIDHGDGTTSSRNSIKRILDDVTISSIPMSNSNIDYQEYLAWVAEGNTAEAASDDGN